MKNLYLGRDRDTNAPVELPVSAFSTHLHLPGATGKGKSTAILLMLKQLLLDWRRPHCHVVVDFLGGLSHDLLLWMSTDRCTDQVRDRLVLLRPGDARAMTTLNPLLYGDPDEGFFKVNRATELILRAWSAQSLGEQPRLARWLFNAMWACAQLGLTVSDTEHLLLPGSPYNPAIMAILPERLRAEWGEILSARNAAEATRILDSTRNRMKPFHESGILRRMFGSTVNRLDALRFMREGKILLLDLSPRGRLSPHEANAIAGLVVNEFLAAARSLPRDVRYPTYLWLDEFQRLVTPDFEYAIPEMRQLGVRLILAHQSFSQLRTPTTDLTSLIWQPQTRLMFGEQGEDAELLAQEIASLTYDPKRVKNELYSLRQVQVGHDTVTLKSWGETVTDTDTWGQSEGLSKNESDGRARRDGSTEQTRSTGESKSQKNDSSRGGGQSRAKTSSTHEQLVARLEDVRELSAQTFYTFEEQRSLWAQQVRKLHTGVCVARVVNDDRVRTIRVENPKSGLLTHDAAVLTKRFPQVMARYEKLISDNHATEFFASPEFIDREIDERLERLKRRAVIAHLPPDEQPAETPPGGEEPVSVDARTPKKNPHGN